MHLKLVPGGKACDLPYILIYFFLLYCFLYSLYICVITKVEILEAGCTVVFLSLMLSGPSLAEQSGNAGSSARPFTGCVWVGVHWR